MKQIKPYILIAMILFSGSIFCQTTSKSTRKVQTEVNVLAGPIDGERGTSAQIEVIPGIKFNGYHIGIGTGIDYYFIRTVPVFLEFKKAFIPNKNSVFLYADAGFDYPWPSNANKVAQPQLNFTCAHRLAGGIGYQIAVFKNTFLLMSVGYSYKQLKQNVQGWVTIYDPRVDWFDYTQHYNYKLNRLAFNIGLSF